MQLSDVVDTARAVAATSSRTAKVEALAACLRAAAADGGAVIEVVAAHLSGVLPQRRLGVSWRGLQSLPDAAAESSLTVEEVDEAATTIAAFGGSGSAAARVALGASGARSATGAGRGPPAPGTGVARPVGYGVRIFWNSTWSCQPPLILR